MAARKRPRGRRRDRAGVVPQSGMPSVAVRLGFERRRSRSSQRVLGTLRRPSRLTDSARGGPVWPDGSPRK